MVETAPKWHDLAEKSLDPGDEIKKSYPGTFNGESGHLIMSNKKLLFVHEEGFLRKAYDLVLDLPYEKIGKISHEGRYDLDLTEVDGKQHHLKTFELPISIIEKNLKELIKTLHT